MLNEYLARERVADWRRMASERERLVATKRESARTAASRPRRPWAARSHEAARASGTSAPAATTGA